MSDTFALVCHETQKCVWIGQGSGTMEVFYSGAPETMNALKRFLCDHIGKPLVFVNDSRWTGPEDIDAYDDYAFDDRLNRRDSFRVL